MSSEYAFKITYHLGVQKRINYMHKRATDYASVKSYISNWLFNELGYPKCDLRLFWIDLENDEVDILSEEDYNYFFRNFAAFSSKRMRHLHVTTVDERKDELNSNGTSKQTKVPPAEGSYEFAVHDHVECDGCLMAPIIGFRYKCIECPNYDLCQNCESKHVHSEHMMVRMPTKYCPTVVESYITGRSSGRKHAKRSKNLCPFVKNGLSVIIDDNNGEKTNAGGDGNAEQPSSSGGKERTSGRRHHRRHNRNNFFSHLYEMMHDLAEGGGAAAAAHATGAEDSSPTKTTTTTSGPHTTTEDCIAVQIAAQEAHETALKAAEIASKVAHETAVQAAKQFTAQSMFTPNAPAAEQTTDNSKEKNKVDATTSPHDESNSMPILPVSQSLETLAQFLDPQYMKAGIQILNNFSDMFARMLDPMDNVQEANRSLLTNTTTSTKSSVSSNLNTISDAKELEKSIEKQQNNEETNEDNKEAAHSNLLYISKGSTKSSVSSNLIEINGGEKEMEKEKSIKKQPEHMENKQLDSDVLSNIVIEDDFSDSENDDVSNSFVKLDAPKEENSTKSTTANSSAQTTPPQSLNKTNVMDFAQLSANLKAHIAEEAANNASTPIETGVAATEKTAASTNSTTSSTTTTSTTHEMQAVPVYHADQNINTSVHAMMSMGFSNEGAWLTQLLESVDGSIPEALEIMSVAKSNGH